MEKADVIPSKSNASPSPENSRSLSSGSAKGSFTISSYSDDNFRLESNYHVNQFRSKSLSNLHQRNYSPRELRRIKERLLRTNSQIEPSTFRTFTKKQKLTLASLALADFVSFCSMSIMAPFFPKEATEKGLTETVSGFVFSFYALVMFLTSPIFGKVLPRFGAKFIFLSGMFMAGACNLLFGALEYVTNYTMFTALCIVIRGFEALGATAFSTASYVFVVNSFPQNMGSVLGILETFVGLGMSIGPALGGILYSLGGFSMPFFVLGITMVLFVPLNYYLLPAVVEECNVASRTTSIFKLMKVPAVLVTGLVVVVVSSSWAFLDPTLEPHLRQFNLTPERIGLIFLLFSALYGISSPAWGWLADKVNHHWSMMVAGLLMCTVGLLLLGPCPYIPYLKSSVWLDLIALSLLGISVALALLPTFQGLLSSAMTSGCGDTISTYSVVAGVWSCVYSLGEVIGPSLGGFLLQHCGFPVTATIMGMMTFSVAVLTFVFFIVKENFCADPHSSSDSGISESWKTDEYTESSPLLLSTSDTNLRMYTEGKVQYYGQSRKYDSEMGELDKNQLTDVRGTMAITAKGSCEV